MFKSHPIFEWSQNLHRIYPTMLKNKKVSPFIGNHVIYRYVNILWRSVKLVRRPLDIMKRSDERAIFCLNRNKNFKKVIFTHFGHSMYKHLKKNTKSFQQRSFRATLSHHATSLRTIELNLIV